MSREKPAKPSPRKAADWLALLKRPGLAERLELHDRLLAVLRHALPTHLQGCCRACWIDRHGRIILGVEGQEYAAQVRFFGPAMAEAAGRLAGRPIKEVTIRALPRPAKPTPPMQPAGLTGIAKRLADDARYAPTPEIAAALRRLAATLAGRDGSNNAARDVEDRLAARGDGTHIGDG